MGIPRLSQDLLPYAERLTLSSASRPSSQQGTRPVTSLIIDGPSLVYFIYNKLLAYKISSSPILIAQQPSYEEINQCVTQFLLDLDARGVEIQRLFFDGALPVSKHEVRLERMEKLRQQLDAYRKTFPDFPSLPTLPDITYDKALWSTAIISSRKLTLPALPFMVASVIEYLQGIDKWRDTVQVVNDEADIFCAMLAKESGGGGAAILTNDSDMAVHDIGPEGRIVLLHSLEKRFSSPQAGNVASDGPITALVFNPRQVAERLQVPSLLRFGFERYLDPSLSVAMVKERARQSDRLEQDKNLREEFEVFSEQYEELPSTTLSFPQQHHQREPCISNDLDPRTAELVFCPPESSPNVYLTPMNEDPSRDSSWSYGSDIRHVAYSLLLLLRIVQRSSPATSAVPLHTTVGAEVTEYARKGQRITSTTLTCLEVSQIQEHISTLLQSLPGGEDKTSTITVVSASESESKIFSTRHQPPPLLLLTWYTFALRSVNEHKLSTGKTPFSTTQALSLFGLLGLHDDQTTASKQQPPKLSWDDMHLLGNMHAVLYSLRILGQLTRHVLVTAAAAGGHLRVAAAAATTLGMSS